MWRVFLHTSMSEQVYNWCSNCLQNMVMRSMLSRKYWCSLSSEKECQRGDFVQTEQFLVGSYKVPRVQIFSLLSIRSTADLTNYFYCAVCPSGMTLSVILDSRSLDNNCSVVRHFNFFLCQLNLCFKFHLFVLGVKININCLSYLPLTTWISFYCSIRQSLFPKFQSVW